MIDETETQPDVPVDEAPIDEGNAAAPDVAADVAPADPFAALNTSNDWILAHQAAIDRGAPLPTPDEIAMIRDPNAQRMVAAALVQRERDRATLAEERARVQAAQLEVEARHRATIAQQQEALRYAGDPRLQAYLDEQGRKPEKIPDFDDPAYPAYAAKQAAVEMLRGFVGQLQTQRQEYEAEHAHREAVAAHEAKVREIQTYIDQYPEDFADPELRGQVKVLHQQHGFPVPDAHRMVVAQRLLADREFGAAAQEARVAAQARVNRGGRPLPAVTSAFPENGTAEQRAAFYERNPDAVRERLKRHLEEGLGYGSR